MKSRLLRLLTLLLLAGGLSACAVGSKADIPDEETEEEVTREFIPYEQVLASEVDESTLESEIGKSDARVPTRFDVLATQSPVRDQGSRGACASFVATAIAEHWYRKQQILLNPDFAEQYLFWQTHGYVASVLDREGSSAETQLKAISQYGIPVESVWPYEATSWSDQPSEHPECEGYAPTRPECMTNGEPSHFAMNAERYWVRNPRAIRESIDELKAYMANTGSPVGIGVGYLSKSWGGIHYRDGIVTLPSASTSTGLSGHAVLAVGWDDEMTAQRVDVNGTPEVDAAGRPVLDRGFILFKNSWGTRGWGRLNSRQPGYGWMSYRYWERYHNNAAVADSVRVDTSRVEVCGNNRDDNGNGDVDCDDVACVNSASCAAEGQSLLQFVGPASIPDNSTVGVRTSATESRAGTITAAVLATDIRHSFVGDLQISLIHPSGLSIPIRTNTGGAVAAGRETIVTHALDGLEAAGEWSVLVKDTAFGDYGTVQSWTLAVMRCTRNCATPLVNRARVYYDSNPHEIPDDDVAGVDLTFDVDPGSLASDVRVSLDIAHSEVSDLEIVLSREGGQSVTIVPHRTYRGANLKLTDLAVPQFVGTNPYGRWHLRVRDLAAVDVGRVLSYGVTIRRR